MTKPLFGALILPVLLFPTTPRAEIDRDKIHRFREGRQVFEKNCIDCHGKRGRGDGPLAEGTKDKPRNFRTGIFKFRTTPRGYLPTDLDLKRTIETGVTGTTMPTFKKLSEKEREAVIGYLKYFSPKWKNPKFFAKPVAIPDPPGWMGKEKDAEPFVKAGRRLFAIHCVSCHGTEGRGDGVASTGLKDVWENDIRPADLTKPHHKSGPGVGDLFRTIALGLDGTPMIGYLDSLGEEKIWRLVAFIRSIERDETKS